MYQMTLAEEQESQVYDMVTESDNYENDEGKDQSEGNDNEEKLVNGDKTEEDKAEEDKTTEDKTTEDKTEEDKTEEDKTEEDKPEEDKPEEDKSEEAKTEEKESDDEYKPEEKESEDEESDNELLITPTKEKTKTKKPKLVVKGTKTAIKQVNDTDCAPHVPNLSDKDMEKTDEEPSDMESETEMNEITGFPVYKSKNIKFGQLYMNKNKLIYVTKDNDTIKDVENVLSNTKLKRGCIVHVPGVEFEVYTGKPKGRPPKGKTWDDSNKEWIEKGTLKRKLNEDFDDEVQIKVVRF
tara:strand:+ start:128 stop:1012 length:885 start_codon:yes stop_codon:yes gene_type:complete